jgi:hypothetical protein
MKYKIISGDVMKIERDERRFDFHDIGLAIKRAREANGMTQEQLTFFAGSNMAVYIAAGVFAAAGSVPINMMKHLS